MKTLSMLFMLMVMAFGLFGVTPTTADPYRGPTANTKPAEEPAVDLELANEVLDGLRRKYRYLDGVSVTSGPTPKDEQAVAYYTEGDIVISPTHAASIEKILAHEIWHIIDWRDNGRLDWGEDLPPQNASDYLR